MWLLQAENGFGSSDLCSCELRLLLLLLLCDGYLQVVSVVLLGTMCSFTEARYLHGSFDEARRCSDLVTSLHKHVIFKRPLFGIGVRGARRRA